MKSFFSEAIKSIKTTGSIKPSSKHLVKNCLSGLAINNADVIIEFGPGNGCFTEEIVNGISSSTRLYAFEINSVFYNYGKSKYASYNNIFILNQSALDLDLILREQSIEKVDFIISSLPLAILKEEEKKSLLGKIKRNLKEGGVFVQYQYSLGSLKELKSFFRRVDIELIIRNLPPAFIYKCYV